MQPKEADAIEYDSTRLLGVCVVFLLIFTVGYWIVNPAQEHPSYSTLEWVTLPHVETHTFSDAIDFEVLLSSFESSEKSYRVESYLNGHLSKTQMVSLNSFEKQGLAFSVPISAPLEKPAEIRVRVNKLDVNGNIDMKVPLEIFDWVAVDEN